MPVRLTDTIFWCSAICCALAQAAILRSVIVAPVRAADTGRLATGKRIVDIVWAVLPGIALVLVFVFTWRVMHGAPVIPSAPSAMP